VKGLFRYRIIYCREVFALAKVQVVMDTVHYFAGDKISGHVIITSKKDLKQNGITVLFRGQERVSFTEGSDEDEENYYETRSHVEQVIELVGKGKLPSGEHKFPFEFDIPGNVPSSYRGSSGNIIYVVIGKIERSWTLDPKDYQEIKVYQPAQMDIRNYVTTTDGCAYIQDNETRILSVEFLDDGVQLMKLLHFKVMISNDVKIRGLRTRLMFRETVKAQGRYDKSLSVILEDYFPESDIQRDAWIHISMESKEVPLIPMGTQLIRAEPILQVTLDIPRRLDISKEIPLYQIDESWHTIH